MDTGQRFRGLLLLLGITALSTYASQSLKYIPQGPQAHKKPIAQSMQGFEKKLRAEHVKLTRQGEKIQLILPADELFEKGLQRQDYQDLITLYTVLQFYKKYGKPPIEIVGYTDQVGNKTSLIEKSRLQAQSVAAFFWAHGIPRDSLIIKGKGPKQQLDSRSSAKASASNRRIEIHFLQTPKTLYNS